MASLLSQSNLHTSQYKLEPIKKTSFTHLIYTQDDLDNVTDVINYSENNSYHVILLYAHGSDDSKLTDTLKTIKNNESRNYIFLDQFNEMIKLARKKNVKICLIAISCFWNKKYDINFGANKTLLKPTLTFGSYKTTRLPYPIQRLINKINDLPSDFDHQFIESWLFSLKDEFDNYMSLVSNFNFEKNAYDEPGEYHIIYE